MDKATEMRVNAAISEIAQQRNQAFDRAATFAGEVAVLKAQLEDMMKASERDVQAQSDQATPDPF